MRSATLAATRLPRRSAACIVETEQGVLLCSMHTLSEIEAAVDQLSHSEQETLLEHLAQKLGARLPVMVESQAKRERWLQKLDRLPTRRSTGKTGAPLQEILDDIRAERC
jgi:hypothetical protein